MYKSSFSSLSVRLLGAIGVWHGTMIMITNIHLSVVKGYIQSTTLYMGITMA